MSLLQRLESPNLDNLRFQQDLVDEARKRIIQYCPEWTEYNLSDPGITLIELFAWMTEAIIYRLNQVPQKNYIEFLKMLDVQLHPARAARTELTFYLSAPFPLRPTEPELTPTATVEKGLKVATPTAADGEEIIFTTDEELCIIYPRLAQVRTSTNFTRNYYEDNRVATFNAFATEPVAGDSFFLGFTNNIAGNVLRLHFDCQKAEAAGIRRDSPPLKWFCYLGKDEAQQERWRQLSLGQGDERDTTGGFRNARGNLTLYLPLDLPQAELRGIAAYWLRCQYLLNPAEPTNRYTESPVIDEIRAEVIGSTVRATNAVFVYKEELGRSSGDPGQVFKLKHTKILNLGKDETVQVEERHGSELTLIDWQRVPGFDESDQHDRHFMLDTDRGEICFGPSIRQADGAVRQYGCVPPMGRRICISQYRYSGGAQGNVPKQQITIMHASQPYIDRVTNLKPADHGRDQETVEEAMMRAQRTMRYQQRAVTAAEFEQLALSFETTLHAGTLNPRTIKVARAHCLAASKEDLGRYQLLVIPIEVKPLYGEEKSTVDKSGDSAAISAAEKARKEEEQRQWSFDQLAVDNELKKLLRIHLDQYRLLTAPPPVIREPVYLGVRVIVELVKDKRFDDTEVQKRVREALFDYITPLKPPAKKSNYPNPYQEQDRGWRFGQTLFVAELFSLIQNVAGVQHVLKVALKQRPIVPGREHEASLTDKEKLEQDVADNKIQVHADTVLCSLDHQVKIVTL